jgi:hypothetical protein
MRYQFTPDPNGGIVATGANYKLRVVYDSNGWWRAEITSLAPDYKNERPWGGPSPDLIQALTTGMAMLRTLDTDGLL